MFVPILIFIVMIVLAVGMLVFVNTVSLKPRVSSDKKQPLKEPEEIPLEKHVMDLINVDEVYKNGIYRIGSMYFGVGILNGTNFSVISDDSQNSKEDRIVRLLSQVRYPTQTIATTIVANTAVSAEDILKRAKDDDTNVLQKIYMKQYANFLTKMKAQRAVLSRENWFIIGSLYDDEDPENEILRRFAHLAAEFRRIGVVLTRVTTDVEVYDIIHQILLPDRIVAPSERFVAGVTEPLHWSGGELRKGVN